MRAALVLAAVLFAAPFAARGAETLSETAGQLIFPGQCEPEISAGIVAAFNAALARDYPAAREIVLELGRRFPDNPAGPAGEMVLYQVMMLENEDYEYDAEFRGAARRAVAAADRFAATAPKNDWYYTLLGATWGMQGIYFLRRDEFLTGVWYGSIALYYMNAALSMSDGNWEANMGRGLYLYYRSAYASFIPIAWIDQREEGIDLVRQAGERRSYLHEVSRIALFYIYVNEKDYDRAFGYIDGLIAERPDFPIFYQFAGRALMGKGDYERAAEYYRRMSAIAPELYLPPFKLGECALAQGKKEEARQYFALSLEVLGGRDSEYRAQAEKYLRELDAGK